MITRSVVIAAAVGALAVGMAGPAQAKPKPPHVTVRPSVTIPWYGCHDTTDWARVRRYPRTRIVDKQAISVRKRGLTHPVSYYEICGYMGSGTYTVKTKLDWQVRKKEKRSEPVYRYRTVRKFTGEYTPKVWEWRERPITCTLYREYIPNTSAAFYHMCDPPSTDEWC